MFSRWTRHTTSERARHAAEEEGRKRKEQSERLQAYLSALPPERLAKLARHEDGQVRPRVARNPSTPGETLIRLASDPLFEVRFQSVGRYDALPEALRVLAGDKDASIRVRAAHNASTPLKALHTPAKDTHPAVVRAAESALAKRKATLER